LVDDSGSPLFREFCRRIVTAQPFLYEGQLKEDEIYKLQCYLFIKKIATNDYTIENYQFGWIITKYFQNTPLD
jgi:hypothetical protein